MKGAGAAVALACAGCTPTATTLWIGGDLYVDATTPGRLAALGGPGVVNLECAVAASAQVQSGASTAEQGRLELRCPSDVGSWLADEGVVAVGLANNHAEDDGAVTPGAALLEQAGLGVARQGAGYRDQAHGWWLGAAHADHDGWAEQLAPPQTGDDVPAIALVHTSDVAGYLPSQRTEAGVEALVDAGWDVVAVSGSHRVGAIERREDAVIAWGLGNLLFDCDCTSETEALVLQLELGGTWRDRDQVLDAQLVPIRAGLHGAPAILHEDTDAVMELVAGLSTVAK